MGLDAEREMHVDAGIPLAKQRRRHARLAAAAGDAALAGVGPPAAEHPAAAAAAAVPDSPPAVAPPAARAPAAADAAPVAQPAVAPPAVALGPDAQAPPPPAPADDAPAPPQRRARRARVGCPVPGRPRADLPSSAGWADHAAMRPHLNEHAVADFRASRRSRKRIWMNTACRTARSANATSTRATGARVRGAAPLLELPLPRPRRQLTAAPPGRAACPRGRKSSPDVRAQSTTCPRGRGSSGPAAWRRRRLWPCTKTPRRPGSNLPCCPSAPSARTRAGAAAAGARRKL